MHDSASPNAPLATALNIFAWAVFGLVMAQRVTGWDLAPLYIAATLVCRGQIAHLYDHDAVYFDLAGTAPWVGEAARIALGWDAFPYIYPPLWAAILAPVVRVVDFATFTAVTIALHVAALAAMLHIATRCWAPLFLRPVPYGVLALAMIFSRPVFDGLILGQVQPLVGLGIVGAIASSQRQRPALAGAALAFAASVKLTPAALAIYWLLRGRRDCAAWFAVLFGALVLASVGLAGWSAHLDYLEALDWIGDALVFGLNNQSLLTWLGHFSVPRGELLQYRVLPAPWPIRILSPVLVLGAIAGAAWLARTRRLEMADEAALMFALMLAVMMALPIAWHHYYALLAVPAMLLAQGGARVVPVAMAVLVSMWLYPFGHALVERGSSALAWNELIAAMLCLGALVQRLARAAQKRPAL